MSKMAIVTILLVLVIVLTGILILMLMNQRNQGPVSMHTPEKQSRAPQGVRRNWLVGLEGEVEGKTFHIGERTVTIGRAVSNFVQLQDPDASRVHCRVTPMQGSLQVQDLQSQKGTQINDDPVGSRLLRDGDKLRIANNLFEFKLQGDYQSNHGLDRKNADMRAYQPTEVGNAEMSVENMVREALARTGGDVFKAAELSGLRIDVVEKHAEKLKRK